MVAPTPSMTAIIMMMMMMGQKGITKAKISHGSTGVALVVELKVQHELKGPF